MAGLTLAQVVEAMGLPPDTTEQELLKAARVWNWAQARMAELAKLQTLPPTPGASNTAGRVTAAGIERILDEAIEAAKFPPSRRGHYAAKLRADLPAALKEIDGLYGPEVLKPRNAISRSRQGWAGVDDARTPDDFALNPLVDELRRGWPDIYAQVSRLAPVPRLFHTDDLPPGTVWRPNDSGWLLDLPWQARWPAALAAPAQALAIWQQCMAPGGVEWAQMTHASHAENAAYAERVRAFAMRKAPPERIDADAAYAAAYPEAKR
ncbi:MAG TPA: hypothetical protein VII16_08530 [Actinomycetes bacterium]|jgi:hypothetical protein